MTHIDTYYRHIALVRHIPGAQYRTVTAQNKHIIRILRQAVAVHAKMDRNMPRNRQEVIQCRIVKVYLGSVQP